MTRIALLILLLLPATATLAHDPVFGLGPHTLFKQGVEVHVGADRDAARDAGTTITSLELAYGLSANWTLRGRLPYVRTDRHDGETQMALASKYRFWRRDGLGMQQSASAFINLQSGASAAARSGYTTNTTFGLAYGYESRRWYRWAALRYLNKGKGDSGQRLGDILFLDLVGGIRFRPTHYLEPDWVWMLELNGERTRKHASSPGEQWFVSPGLMWTLRNFAIKTGAQLPLWSNLQNAHSRYRARLELEWHF